MADIDWDALVNDKMGNTPDDNAPSNNDGGADTTVDDDKKGVVADAPSAAADSVDTPAADDKPAPVDDKTDEEKAEEARVAAKEKEAELAKDETPEETTARHNQEAIDKKAEEDAAAAAAEDETPSNLSVDDIKKVLDERDQQVKFDAKRFEDISLDVAKDLYPNGFDTTLKDESGHVIANAADYKQYIDPNATTEEAERVIMSEQSRLNREIQQAKDFILDKAELKHNMENDAVKVFTKYKDYFLKNPDMQQKIAANYRKTLTVQGETIMNAPMGLEEFYDFAMKPYIDNQPAASVVTAPVAPVVAKPKEQVNNERLDLLGAPSGQDDAMTKSDGSPNWGKIVKDKMK